MGKIVSVTERLDRIVNKLSKLESNSVKYSKKSIENRHIEHNIKRGILKLTAEYSNEIVPVDTGYLKSTLYTEYNKGKFIIGYRAKYAAYVHESLENRHANGKSAKFLEIAFNNAVSIASYLTRNKIILDYEIILDAGEIYICF